MNKTKIIKKTELIDLYSKFPAYQVARILGVCRMTLNKNLKMYNIPLKGKGFGAGRKFAIKVVDL